MGEHRLNRSREDLFVKLNTSVQFIKNMLRSAIDLPLSDSMRTETAAVIATKLRVLLSDSQRSHSLLGQVNLKNQLLFRPACAYNLDLAANPAPSYSLVALQLTASGHFFCVPQLGEDRKIKGNLLSHVNGWLNEIVIDTKGENPALVTRNEIIRILCDKEGGAHVDPELSESFYKVNFDGGFIAVINNKETCIQNNFFTESLFVIAEEFIEAIERYNQKQRHTLESTFDTDHCIIRLTYQDGKEEKYRYFLPQEDLALAMRIGFDCYKKAKYEIYNTQYTRFISEHKVTFGTYRIDSPYPRKLVYLRSDKEKKNYVLCAQGDQYILINDKKDLKTKKEAHDLEYYKTSLSNNNADTFDEFLDKQLL